MRTEVQTIALAFCIDTQRGDDTDELDQDNRHHRGEQADDGQVPAPNTAIMSVPKIPPAP
ncbi:hypothetical protein SAMN05216236_102212 [Sedimentitalea nanhaiensis]|uniref:Uncharacterized protein n=1 Tax=Sedimentitalea nanhaiensis TaxID=999627 RepID=A0A1I6YHR3_9RHOB|nr:hypothetical protein SAMN05216236_102212 [Sedimentitalea nanhaiensis]